MCTCPPTVVACSILTAFPFLEGRKPKTSWRDTEATPLPVNNRTVLHLLEALATAASEGAGRRSC